MNTNSRRALIGFTLMMSLLLGLGLISLLDLPGWRAQAQTAVPEISVEQPFGTVIADGGSQDFGAVAKGSNQTLTFTIRNTGNAPLNLTGNPKVVIGGAHAADFTVTTQPASPVPANNVIVPNGGFESPNVALSALGSGAYSGNWTFSQFAGVAANSGGFYYVLPAPEGDQAGRIFERGHSISQVINFPSTGKYFIHFFATNDRGDLAGQIDVNMDGTLLGTALGNHERDDIWRTFYIPYNCTAAGNHTLSFNQVTQGGSVIDDVRITAGDVFQVTFTPQGAGVRTATLSIANNDSNENPYNITLTGIGVPEISIEQPAGTPLVTGKVVAWGYNQQGQTNVPAGLEGVKAIAAGGLHTVALKGDGTVVSWGLFTQEAVPVWLTNVTAIAAGDRHTLALKSDGTVVAWGNNDILQATVPTGLSGVVAIAANNYGSAALKSDGTIVKWGYNLGTIPAGLTNVVDLAMGQTHTVALKSDGTVAAWGENFQGEANVPPDLAGVTAIAAGGYRSYAVKSNGKIVAWGAIDTFADGLTGVVDVAAGPHQTLALKNDATITAWGPNRYGETNVPAGLEGVRAISANGRHSGDMESHSVALTDSTVDFGNQLVGVASAWKTFTVKNTGIGSLTISNVSVSGGDASNFDVNLSGMLTTVPPNGQTTFAVRFTPDSLAPKQASLRVLNNDTDEGSFYINLTGAGATPSPEIAVFNGASTAPAEERASNVGTYTFPSTFVGNTSSTHTFTIKNVGTANLSGIAITMAGANPEDFVLNTSGVSTLSPNLTRTFTVSFKPVAAGVRNAVVSIASNDPDENPFLINISGTGEKITYTFTASNTNDSGPGSLRQAMADAASDDTINFNLSGCPCTITLTSGQLPVDKTLKIIGPGANRLTISGNNASRVFEIVNDSTLTLTGLTIANGRHADNGGGIFSNHGGLLRVNDCNLSNNHAGSHGGAIFMGGPVNPDVQKLIIRNSLLALNHAVADGGAIYNASTHMTIINSTISNNTAGGSGGGIFDDNVGTRTLIHCTLTGNRADADGNAAGNGGGIREEFGSNRIEVFRNTIVAGNFRGTGATPDDLAASIESAQNTLIGDAATAGGITNGTNGNKVEVPVNTVLDTVLAFNFGPTRTHKLIAGSPALDAGSNALALDADGSPLQTDQRGPGATRIVNGVVDMGAFELSLIQTQPPAITGATISRQQGTSASNSQIATVSDPQDNVAGLTVTATPASGTGVTVNSISVDGLGNVSASVAAGCTATNSTFTLRVTNSSNLFAEATLTVNVSQTPTPAMVGGTQTICALGTSTGLGGNTPAVGTGMWSIVSGGTGTFNPNAATPNATFTHTGGAGPILLRWTISNGACSATSADVTITINQPPTTATVGPNQTLVVMGTSTGLGGNTPAVGTGMWSIVSGGTGTFNPNAATPNATFTHTGGAGPIVLRWTISNAPCPPSAATLTLSFNAPPVVSPTPVTVQAGSLIATKLLATVSDDQTPVTSLTAQINGAASATVNGVTVCGLTINAAGQLQGRVVAICGATTPVVFTLNITDGAAAMTNATLTVIVTSNSGPTLSYPAPPSVVAGNGLTVNPATGPGDNGSIASLEVKSITPAFSGTVNVASPSGVVTISNAAPAGSFTVVIRAMDNCGVTTDAPFTLNVTCPTITFEQTSLPGGTVGSSYTGAVTASPALSYNYLVESGALPSGLTLNSTTGAISGTPTAMGTFNFIVSATAGICTGSRSYTITIVCPTIAIAPNTLSAGEVGIGYSQPLSVTPSGTYYFSVLAGGLPNGLMLNVTTGVISGTPTMIGTYSFTIKAQGSSGCSATKQFTIVINCPTIAVNPATLPNGTQGTNYSQTVSAMPAGGNYSYMVTSGAPPTGLNLNAVTGVLSGTPTVNGSFTFTVTAKGFGNCTQSRAYTVMISSSGGGSCPTITLPPSLPNGKVGQVYSNAVTASPSNSYNYTSTGSLPPGVMLNSPFGLLYGYPTTPGSYTFTITATAGACSGSQQYTVIISSGAGPTSIRVVNDFDGDGRSDFALWSEEEKDWLIVGSRDSEVRAARWKVKYDPQDDALVSGDYDGDGKYDLAIFRRSTGEWLIQRSSDGEMISERWGDGTPVPADYDGDGRTDLAIWQSASGKWSIKRSRDGAEETAYWGASDVLDRSVPVVSDYDGDGKADLAVYHSLTHRWQIKLSSDGLIIDREWGVKGDLPMASDYDGDGRADLAVWRGSDNNWYIVHSSDDSVQTMSWGTASRGDVPVPGDYDGDGKADVAVWRGTDATWYVKRSSDQSVLTKTHGQTGDTPATARRQ